MPKMMNATQREAERQKQLQDQRRAALRSAATVEKAQAQAYAQRVADAQSTHAQAYAQRIADAQSKVDASNSGYLPAVGKAGALARGRLAADTDRKASAPMDSAAPSVLLRSGSEQLKRSDSRRETRGACATLRRSRSSFVGDALVGGLRQRRSSFMARGRQFWRQLASHVVQQPGARLRKLLTHTRSGAAKLQPHTLRSMVRNWARDDDREAHPLAHSLRKASYDRFLGNTTDSNESASAESRVPTPMQSSRAGRAFVLPARVAGRAKLPPLSREQLTRLSQPAPLACCGTAVHDFMNFSDVSRHT